MTVVIESGQAPAAQVSSPVTPAAAVRGGSGRRWRWRSALRSLLPAVGAVTFVGLWEWTGRAGTFGTSWVPLTDIWAELGEPGRAELIQRAARATFDRAATGLVVGFTLAVGLASLASLVPRVRNAVNGASVAINSVPWVALGPLLMIIVSRDRAPSVIAGLAVFFPSLVAATAGLTAATRDQEDLCTALGAPVWRRFLLVRLPNALPSFVLGLKLAVPAAIVGAVFGEWFGAERGLGMLLLTSMQGFRPELLWAVGLLAAAVTMLSYGVLSLVERWAAGRFSFTVSDTAPRPPVTGRRWVRVAAWAATGAATVLVWHVYVEVSGISPLLMPAPLEVWRDAVTAPGFFLENALTTVRMGVLGLVAGITLGTGMAIVTWWSGFLRGFLTPVVIVARAVPTLALLPVVAGILGYNDRTVLAIGILISFFPGFVYASKGLRTPPEGAEDVMATLGASRRRVFLLVALPGSVRHVGVALRLSAGVCVIAAVVAEFLIGERGLGRVFAEAMGRQDINRAWGVALVIVAVSMIAFAAANRAERALTERFS
jgi:ABC-type nitrate/sulfonate/bicarbonate transport system permease component